MSLRDLLGLAALLIGAAPPQVRGHASAERIRAHVEFLASDLLEGRDTGSRGHQIAANYVACEFRQLGLKPWGPNGGWFVQVPFRRATLAGPPSDQPDRQWPQDAGRDRQGRGGPAERDRAEVSLSAPLVFVGYGVRDAGSASTIMPGSTSAGRSPSLWVTRPRESRRDRRALVSMQAQIAAARGAVGFISIDDAGRAARDVAALRHAARGRLGRCARPAGAAGANRARRFVRPNGPSACSRARRCR